MSEKEQKRSGGLVALVVLLLIVTIVSAILATYAWAKYTERKSGEATANVAKWNVSATSGNLGFSKTFTHVVSPNKLAPGTDGTIAYTLDVTGTEVDVDYTVTLLRVEVVDQSSTETPKAAYTLPDANHRVPVNLKVYKKDTTINAATGLGDTANLVYDNGAIVDGGVVATGRINASTGTYKVTDEKFVWSWPYESKTNKDDNDNGIDDGDDDDTLDGQRAETLRFVYRVDFKQVQPAAAP